LSDPIREAQAMDELTPEDLWWNSLMVWRFRWFRTPHPKFLHQLSCVSTPADQRDAYLMRCREEYRALVRRGRVAFRSPAESLATWGFKFFTLPDEGTTIE
jgi:hypothetical protein